MPFSWDKIEKPIVALAPMAGYTDSPFRRIAKEIAPEIICFSELTSTNALQYENEKTLRMLEFDKSESPLIIQLFGNNPQYFVDAAKKLEQMGIAGIDINMGCPARKVINAEQGSALLKDPNLAADIIHQTAKNISIPISVKTRIGYEKYEEETLIENLQKFQQAGAKLITLHGRTTRQAFSGEADWEPIYLAKENLEIPVIGNGDIDSPQKAHERLKNLDGVMIGRATYGNPWILKETYALLHGQKYQPPQELKEKIPIIKKHLQLNIEQKGPKYGVQEMRKHLGCYIKNIDNASLIRQKLMKAESEEEITQILIDLQG